MVDFRYHLVSIVAVFLALAVGIVVGTTALNGPVLDDLNARVSGLTEDKRSLEDLLREAQTAGEDQQTALLAVAPLIAEGRLDGARVVIVSTEDAPAQTREDLLPLLRAAGATVGAQVRLQPALFDAANGALLTDLVANAAVPGEELPEGEPLDMAMAQLASVLVRTPAPAGATPAPQAVPIDVVERVVAAYAGENMLKVDGEVGEPATLALVLTGDPVETSDEATGEVEAERVRALLGLAGRLDSGSAGAVVAGPLTSVQDGGVVRALREDAGAAEDVSSVSGVEQPAGRLAAVLALQEQAAGRSGAYGLGAGSQAPLPPLDGS